MSEETQEPTELERLFSELGFLNLSWTLYDE